MYKFYGKSAPFPGRTVKFLIIMKLCFLLLIIPLIQLSATTRAQNITVKKDNVSLVEIFRDIRKQTNYDFLYSNKQLANAKRVSVNVTNGSVSDVLDICFKEQPFTYTIKNKDITIIPKPDFFDRIIKRFTAIDVRGVVHDENNQPLGGVVIAIKTTLKRTITNEKGEFSFAAIDEKSVIVISYLGYENQEIPVSAEMGIIRLLPIANDLNEVEINAGYYTVKDRERTGSISTITAEQIGRQPVNNPLMALQGNMPGIQITQKNGLPGGALSVQIRGQNSIRSGNDPLYIIDGVNYPSTKISGSSTNLAFINGGVSPLSLINPGDIQSIEVLKDADATAIYGSRGANGVILITTKRGQHGATKVNATLTHGYSEVGHRIELLNTDQYLQMRKEAYKNDGLQPSTTDYDVNGIWDQSKYTDWQKVLIGGKAQVTNASLNISGGTDKSNYIIAGNYYKEGTVFPGSFGFQRGGIRSNINLGTAEDRFTASLTASYNHTQSNLFAGNLTNYIMLPPNAPDPYDQYGQLNWYNNTVFTNPMANLQQISNAGTDNLIGNLVLNYRILKNLVLKASAGYTTIRRDELQKTPLASYSPLNNYTSAQRVSFFSNNYNNNWTAEPMLTYNTTIGKGKFDGLIGMSFQNSSARLNTIRAADFSSDALMENMSSAAVLTTAQNDYSQYRYIAIFGRLNYNLADKYFVNLTARRDGSSRFGPGKQFADFGAIGTAWVFSEEKFIKENLSFLNFGKLRASYGVTGNDQISNYGYLQLWNSNGTYQGSSTLSPTTQAPNSDFAWETNRKLEAAIQLGFLHQKINLEFSYYRNKSSNQLLSRNLPASTGLGSINANLPAIVQNTGIELNSSFQILDSGNWQWSAGFNLTIPKNKLLSYPDLDISSDAINYSIGKPLSILKAYNVGIDQQTGLYTIEDKNRNGAIDDGDRYLDMFLGQYYYGGLNNSIKYKQFTFDLQFSFAKQNGESYRTLTALAPGRWTQGTTSNQYSEVLSRWQESGDQTQIQKFTTISDNNTLNSRVKSLGNLSIVDASYLRLRNVSLSYTLPKKWIDYLRISNAQVTLQGQNLFTFTNYIGLDPESQGFNLPPLRTIMFGLNLIF